MQGEAAGTLNCGVRMQQRHDSDFSGPHFWLCFILYYFFIYFLFYFLYFFLLLIFLLPSEVCQQDIEKVESEWMTGAEAITKPKGDIGRDWLGPREVWYHRYQCMKAEMKAHQ